MATVTMTLKEYDELKGQLLSYEHLVDELCTPEEDTWSLQWFQERDSATFNIYSRPLNQISQESQVILLKKLYQKLDYIYGNIGEFQVDDTSKIALGTFSHTEKSHQEEEETE